MKDQSSCFSTVQLQLFLSEQLEPSQEEAVSCHVDDCLLCRQRLEELSEDDLVRDYIEAVRKVDLSTAPDVGNCDVPMSLLAEDDADGSDWLKAVIDPTTLPKRFGKFNLERLLGSGGFGTVYLAEDVELGRKVAIKIPHLLRLSPGFRRRFLREGKAVACLHHPNIVSVLEAGEWGNISYLVTEFVDGLTLREYLLQNPGGLSEFEAVRIVYSLSKAVQHAHQNQVIHRDIKPSNVLLDQRYRDEGLSFRPLLTDFGTARICDMDRSATVDDLLIGTVPYMAPEQIQGKPIGAKCDLYALGVMLFELLTGRRPIEGLDSTSMLHQIATMHSPDLHQIKPSASRDLSAICSKCLERTPDKRYASAGQLAEDLNRFVEGLPTIARPLGPPRRIMRWCRRNPIALTLVGVPVLTVAIIACGLTWHVASLRALNFDLEEAMLQSNYHLERAESSERNALGLLYAADMRLAELAWRKSDLLTARELLNRHASFELENDFRGLEWHYLNHLVRARTETLATHDEWLYCLAIHPNGEVFATAGSKGKIHIHRLDTGELVEEFDSGQIEVNGLAYSRSGHRLASTGDDGTVKIWHDGKLSQQFDGHSGKAYGVAFLASDSRLATCGTDVRVKLWDLESGSLIETYEDHRDSVESITSSSSGRFLASVGQDNLLVVRDMKQDKLLIKSDTHHGTLANVAFSRDEKYVAVVASAGKVKLLSVFNVATGQLELQRSNPDAFVSVCFSPEGDRIITTDRGGNLKIWNCGDTASGLIVSDKPTVSTIIGEDRIFASELLSDRSAILSVSQSGNVLLSYCDDAEDNRSIDRQTLVNEFQTDPLYTAVASVCFDKSEADLLAAVRVGVAKLRMTGSEQNSLMFAPDGRTWDKIAISHQANLMVGIGDGRSGSDNGVADAETVVRVFELSADKFHDIWTSKLVTSVFDLALSPAGELIAMGVTEPIEGGDRKWLYVLATETGKVLHRLPASAETKARFLPDGNSLMYAVHKDIELLDLTTGREFRYADVHAHGQTELTVSSSGRWLATADHSRVIKLWRLPSMELHATLLGHAAQITGLCFSADDRTLLSSSIDGFIKTWSVDLGRFLMNIRDEQEPGVTMLVLSKQDDSLLFLGNDGSLNQIELSRSDK